MIVLCPPNHTLRDAYGRLEHQPLTQLNMKPFAPDHVGRLGGSSSIRNCVRMSSLLNY